MPIHTRLHFTQTWYQKNEKRKRKRKMDLGNGGAKNTVGDKILHFWKHHACAGSYTRCVYTYVYIVFVTCL